MITLKDESDQDWIFTHEDLPDNSFRALEHLGLNKSETRIWREYVYNDFLSAPNVEDSMSKLEEIFRKPGEMLGAKIGLDHIFSAEELVRLKSADSIVDHGLKVYKTMVTLKSRIERIEKEKIAKDRKVEEEGSSEGEEGEI